ncbi:MAG: VWA domain-containing protein, partial [Bacteroidales bacterium]|nr:VWA domain-containing protein [Bacteroidales bacterium]
MKKIYNILLAAFAFLAFIPVANALDDDPPYKDEGGLCYSKTVSPPNTDGVYTITLESFVTGSVTITNESIPADIVLVLDNSGSMAGTKLANLKTAVKAFIDVIQHNDLYDKDGNRRLDENNQPTSLGNQISIVKFAMNYYGGNSASITPGDTYGNRYGTRKGTYSSDNRPYNATQVRVGFTKTATNTKTVANPSATALEADVQTMKDAVDGMRAGGATAADYGMNLARLLLNSLGSDRNGSARTVVFFTDGSPTHNDGFEDSVANSAISYSNQIKTSGSTDAHPQVFSVGVFDTTNPGTDVTTFMNRISSNHEGATGMGTNQGGTVVSDKFYTNASGGSVDLTEVFQTIAHAAGGSDKDLTNATIANVDIVSASFMLPPGTDASKIKLYTAPYLGTKDAAGYLQFGDKIPKGQNTATYRERQKNDDGTIELVGDPILVDGTMVAKVEPSVSGGKNDKITVTGFDYANNFCGEDDLSTTGYNGHKVIIEIPIMMDPTAVGGPDVATNAPGSGIYINGENIITFDSPHVSLPVNLHIRKEGLEVGESAKFTIQRKYVNDSDAPGGSNPWVDVTSVFVTRREGQAKDGVNAPVTKVMGMPSVDERDKEFVYQIVEDNWSWSYTSAPATATISNQLITNPFIFVNTKKQGIDYKVRHAESKATNTFKTGVTNVEYDDSKENDRTSSS